MTNPFVDNPFVGGEDPDANLAGSYIGPSEETKLLINANPFISPATLPVELQIGPREGFAGPDGELSALGAAGGALAAEKMARPVLSALPTPARIPATIAVGGVGAYLGGFSGDAAESAINSHIEGTPLGFNELVTSAHERGGDEAALDVAFNTLFNVAGLGFRALRPAANDMAQAVQKVIQGGGAGASIGQLTDNAIYKGLEAVVRGAPVGGGKFKTLDLLQEKALVKYSDDFAKRLTLSSDNLTDAGVGRMFLNLVEDGKQAHRLASKELYGRVDDLSGDTMKFNIGPLKGMAQSRLDQLRRTGDIGKTADGGAILEGIVNKADDVLNLQDLHSMRSDLLQRKRGLSTAKQSDPISGNLTQMVAWVDSQLDNAARAGNEDVVAALREANSFWKKGRKNLNNKIIESMISNDDLLDKIGTSLFQEGNVDKIKLVRNAVIEATTQTKQSFPEAWGVVQGGYLRSLLPQSPDQVTNAAIRKLHKNPRMLKTVNAGFSKKQQDSIVELSRVIDEVVANQQSAGGLLTLRQASSGLQMGGATLGIGGEAVAGVGLGAAAGLLGVPWIFSQVAASPALSKKWVKWAKMTGQTANKLAALSVLASELGVDREVIDPENTSGWLPPGAGVKLPPVQLETPDLPDL